MDLTSRMQAIIQNVPSVIYECRLDRRLTTVFVSNAIRDLTGYEPQELMDTHSCLFGEILHPEDKERVIAEIGEALKIGETISLEYRIVTKKGDIRWVHNRGVYNPRHRFLIGSLSDITDHVTTLDRIRSLTQELSWFKQAIDSSAIVAVTDAKGTILQINDQFCRISGYTEEELLGNNHNILNSGVHPPGFFKDMWRTIAHGKTWTGEITNRAKDGSLYTVQTIIFPQKDNKGKVFRYLAIGFDVTHLKEAQKDLEQQRRIAIQASKLASLGEVSAGVAHEINNPLAIITGNLGLIRKFLDDPNKLEEKLQTIQRAADRIAKIVMGLRKFSRSSERSPRQDTPVSKVVAEAVNLTESRALKADCCVYMDIQQDPVVNINEIEIEQVLINLINNAIDATAGLEERKVTIITRQEGQTLLLEVRDSGKGISPDDLARLFTPFFTTKEVGKGTGLGLSISRGIAESHEGTLETVPTDVGACFRLSLPIANRAFTRQEEEKPNAA